MLENEDNGDLDIDDFAKALETVFQGKATILDRMRLSCTFYDHESGKTETDDVGQSTYRLALYQ
jgi:NADH kinase